MKQPTEPNVAISRCRRTLIFPRFAAHIIIQIPPSEFKVYRRIHAGFAPDRD